MNLVALKAYLCETGGRVDMKASLGKLEAELMEYQRTRDINESLVRRGVRAVYDKYPGASVSIDGMINLALAEIKPHPSNFNPLKEALIRYMNMNSGERGVAKFGKAGGKGYWRWSDQPQT